ncbi:MAG: hypothetical protein ACR652_24760 [Methylocystis sp.]|uniref:hypothetical protein n=1 Tax=Methylocystis sp. TaxID=1911079 RepID=UPI003DA6954C
MRTLTVPSIGAFLTIAASAVLGLGAASVASAQSPTPPGGTSSPTSANAGTIAASVTYSNAQYATGGVSLRNKRVGAINISGVTGAVKKAYLYWAYLYPVGTTPAANQLLGNFCRWSTGATGGVNIACFGTLQGSRIATGADTCWGGGGIAVYRADVTGLANANGTYQVTLSSTQSADFNNADPWAAPVKFPAAEGASLVLVGTGAKTVAIYDTNLAGKTFSSTLNYTLTLPGAYSSGPFLWDHIGADGQIGAGRVPGLGGETVKINSALISGPTAPNANSDWDGSASWPLSQLWDDTGHDISAAVSTGATSIAVVHTSPNGDCLSPIANVVSY